jgi:hypothetical protein
VVSSGTPEIRNPNRRQATSGKGGNTMAKKVQVSLKEIAKQIDRAEAKLSAGSRAVADREVKKQLAVKIKSLKKVKSELRQICKGSYNIKVPTA